MAKISAILLAAGESRRMGQPKLLLPWGETTVLGQVVATFAAAGVDEMLVVTGGNRGPVESLVAELAGRFPVRAVFNPEYASGGMVSSIQCGLQEVALTPPPPSLRDTSPISTPLSSPHFKVQKWGDRGGRGRVGTLIALGDQPQVRAETVRRILAAFVETGKPLVVPSFQNRRGHPWLAARPLWEDIMAMPESVTPRQFLSAHAGEIEYVEADESILQDLDTPEQYARQRP